jgi:hypothetical protein
MNRRAAEEPSDLRRDQEPSRDADDAQRDKDRVRPSAASDFQPDPLQPDPLQPDPLQPDPLQPEVIISLVVFF